MSYEDSHDKTQNTFGIISKPSSRNKHVDIHELLKQELREQAGASHVLDIKDAVGTIPGIVGGAGESPLVQIPTTAGLPPTPSSSGALSSTKGVRDRYFYLDSDNRDSSSDMANGLLAYDILSINQSKPLDQIIEMEISDFYFPEITTSIQFPGYFFFKRLYLFIREMAGQAVFGHNNYRFHFELGIQPAGITNVTTRIGGNKFIFSSPFRDLSRATFEVTKPPKASSVSFQQDTFNFVSVAGSSPAVITTSVPHGVGIGDDVSVFITTFASNVGNVDSIINDQEGFLVNANSATQFTFDAVGVVGFDFVGVGAVAGKVLIGLRRLSFSIRFRTLEEKETNTITPV